jgi:hypothetical protein
MRGYLQWRFCLPIDIILVVVHLSVIITWLWISSAQHAISENGKACLPQQCRAIGAAESMSMGVVGNRMKVDVSG